MKIGVLGTGTVGQTIGSKLVLLGHEVQMGARTADHEKAVEWARQKGSGATQGTFAEAAAFGELLFNCTNGAASLEALQQAGTDNLDGKLLIDISNPLDFSQGFPPTLSVCNTDSLGEQIQRAFPGAKVVKTLNTVTAALMVNPGLLNDDHVLFVSGNDPQAKAQAKEILTGWFGWKLVVDLGDITSARAAEMVLPLWVRLMAALGTPVFNFKIVR
jgi:predicted dinucleotide-binding enzyme